LKQKYFQICVTILSIAIPLTLTAASLFMIGQGRANNGECVVFFNPKSGAKKAVIVFKEENNEVVNQIQMEIFFYFKMKYQHCPCN